jgi:hypothetical protein
MSQGYLHFGECSFRALHVHSNPITVPSYAGVPTFGFMERLVLDVYEDLLHCVTLLCATGETQKGTDQAQLIYRNENWLALLHCLCG